MQDLGIFHPCAECWVQACPYYPAVSKVHACYLCYVMCHTLHVTKRMPGEKINSQRLKRRGGSMGWKGSPLSRRREDFTGIHHKPQRQAPEVRDCPFPSSGPAQMARGTPTWAPGPEGNPEALNLSPGQSRRGSKRTKTGNHHKAWLMSSESRQALRRVGDLWDLQPPPPTPSLGGMCVGEGTQRPREG